MTICSTLPHGKPRPSKKFHLESHRVIDEMLDTRLWITYIYYSSEEQAISFLPAFSPRQAAANVSWRIHDKRG
jgi:hypothetical protein